MTTSPNDMSTHTEKENHAISNARGWMETIREKIAELDAAMDAREDDKADSLREEMQEMPLSVTVREGWKTPGSQAELDEYQILLSTGGPALRIYGDLGGGEPANVRMEWQDWGTPWTEYFTSDDDDAALLTFASLFYFGE